MKRKSDTDDDFLPPRPSKRISMCHNTPKQARDRTKRLLADTESKLHSLDHAKKSVSVGLLRSLQLHDVHERISDELGDASRKPLFRGGLLVAPGRSSRGGGQEGERKDRRQMKLEAILQWKDARRAWMEERGKSAGVSNRRDSEQLTEMDISDCVLNDNVSVGEVTSDMDCSGSPTGDVTMDRVGRSCSVQDTHSSRLNTAAGDSSGTPAMETLDTVSCVNAASSETFGWDYAHFNPVNPGLAATLDYFSPLYSGAGYLNPYYYQTQAFSHSISTHQEYLNSINCDSNTMADSSATNIPADIFSFNSDSNPAGSGSDSITTASTLTTDTDTDAANEDIDVCSIDAEDSYACGSTLLKLSQQQQQQLPAVLADTHSGTFTQEYCDLDKENQSLGQSEQHNYPAAKLGEISRRSCDNNNNVNKLSGGSKQCSSPAALDTSKDNTSITWQFQKDLSQQGLSSSQSKEGLIDQWRYPGFIFGHYPQMNNYMYNFPSF